MALSVSEYVPTYNPLIYSHRKIISLERVDGGCDTLVDLYKSVILLVVTLRDGHNSLHITCHAPG